METLCSCVFEGARLGVRHAASYFCATLLVCVRSSGHAAGVLSGLGLLFTNDMNYKAKAACCVCRAETYSCLVRVYWVDGGAGKDCG